MHTTRPMRGDRAERGARGLLFLALLLAVLWAVLDGVVPPALAGMLGVG